MRKLLSLFGKAQPETRKHKKRYFSGVSMRDQLTKMRRMNQGIISMSVGR